MSQFRSTELVGVYGPLVQCLDCGYVTSSIHGMTGHSKMCKLNPNVDRPTEEYLDAAADSEADSDTEDDHQTPDPDFQV